MHDFLGGRCPIPRSIIYETIYKIKGGLSVNSSDVEDNFIRLLDKVIEFKDTSVGIDRESFLDMIKDLSILFIHDSGNISKQIYKTKNDWIRDKKHLPTDTFSLNAVTIAGVWDEAEKPKQNRFDLVIKPTGPIKKQFVDIFEDDQLNHIKVTFDYMTHDEKHINYISIQHFLKMDFSLLNSKSRDMGVKKLCLAIKTFYDGKSKELKERIGICADKLFNPKETVFLNALGFSSVRTRSGIVDKFIEAAEKYISANTANHPAELLFASFCFDIKHSMDQGMVKIAKYIQEHKDKCELYIIGYNTSDNYINIQNEPLLFNPPDKMNVGIVSGDRLCYANAKLHEINVCVFPHQSRNISMKEPIGTDNEVLIYQQEPSLLELEIDAGIYKEPLPSVDYQSTIIASTHPFVHQLALVYDEAVNNVINAFNQIIEEVSSFIKDIRVYEIKSKPNLTDINISSRTMLMFLKKYKLLGKNWETYKAEVYQEKIVEIESLFTYFDKIKDTAINTIATRELPMHELDVEDQDEEEDIVIVGPSTYSEGTIEQIFKPYADKMNFKGAKRNNILQILNDIFSNKKTTKEIDLKTPHLKEASRFIESLLHSARIMKGFNIINLRKKIETLTSLKDGNSIIGSVRKNRISLPDLSFSSTNLYIAHIFGIDLEKYQNIFEKIINGKVVGGISGCFTMSISRIMVQFLNIILSSRQHRNEELIKVKAQGLLTDICSVFEATVNELRGVLNDLKHEFSSFLELLCRFGQKKTQSQKNQNDQEKQGHQEVKDEAIRTPSRVINPSTTPSHRSQSHVQYHSPTSSYMLPPILKNFWVYKLFRNIIGYSGGGQETQCQCEDLYEVSWDIQDNIFYITYDDMVYSSYSSNFNYESVAEHTLNVKEYEDTGVFYEPLDTLSKYEDLLGRNMIDKLKALENVKNNSEYKDFTALDLYDHQINISEVEDQKKKVSKVARYLPFSLVPPSTSASPRDSVTPPPPRTSSYSQHYFSPRSDSLPPAQTVFASQQSQPYQLSQPSQQPSPSPSPSFKKAEEAAAKAAKAAKAANKAKEAALESARQARLKANSAKKKEEDVQKDVEKEAHDEQPNIASQSGKGPKDTKRKASPDARIKLTVEIAKKAEEAADEAEKAAHKAEEAAHKAEEAAHKAEEGAHKAEKAAYEAEQAAYEAEEAEEAAYEAEEAAYEAEKANQLVSYDQVNLSPPQKRRDGERRDGGAISFFENSKSPSWRHASSYKTNSLIMGSKELQHHLSAKLQKQVLARIYADNKDQ